MASLCPLCNERPVRPTSTTGICTTCEFQQNLLQSQRRSEKNDALNNPSNDGGCLGILLGLALVGYVIYYGISAFFSWIFG